MKSKTIKSIILMVAMLCLLCFPVQVMTETQQGTNGDELQLMEAEKLEIQLGTDWAGVEFQLKTDAGLYPGTVVVGQDGVLRMEIGGSKSYILTCMNSAITVPEPTQAPYCGSTVVYRSADGIYHENKKGTMLYVCSNFPECDAYVRAHAGTNIPVGSLANHELRSLRRTAHHYFDQLHLSGYMSKQDAYKWLADLVMAPMSEAHIGHLGEYYCKLVIEESRKLLDRPRKMKSSPRFQILQGGAAAS